jgi:cell division protein FtsX
MFSSKDDAFAFLKDRIPEVVDSFQKYGIENPLPATLYVMFENENEYQELRSTIMEYKNIILNIKDIDQ